MTLIQSLRQQKHLLNVIPNGLTVRNLLLNLLTSRDIAEKQIPRKNISE